MKNLFTLIIVTITSFNLLGQSQARIDAQKNLDSVLEKLELETDCTFSLGSQFNFKEPYKAVITKDASLMIDNGKRGNNDYKEFKIGDTVLVLTSLPVGALKRIKAMDSEEHCLTKTFGRPPFEIIENDKFKQQQEKIKASDWKTAQKLTDLLSCGSLAAAGYQNQEKYFMTFGDTPVFYELNKENDRILLAFNLRTYGGNDFYEMGPSSPGTSFIEVSFLDGVTQKFDCVESDDDSRLAAIDITDHVEQFLRGVKTLNFSLKKKASKNISEQDAFAFGIKAECFK